MSCGAPGYLSPEVARHVTTTIPASRTGGSFVGPSHKGKQKMPSPGGGQGNDSFPYEQKRGG